MSALDAMVREGGIEGKTQKEKPREAVMSSLVSL